MREGVAINSDFYFMQVKLAQEHGAVGVILYNDPADSVDLNKAQPIYNDTFPNSWYLPPSGAERGSVMTPLGGDPLTPEFPSKGEQQFITSHLFSKFY